MSPAERQSDPTIQPRALSVMEQRMAALQAIQPSADIGARAFRLEGPMDAERLIRSIDAVTEPLLMLRSRIVQREGAWVRLLDGPAPKAQLIDAPELSDDAIRAEFWRRAAEPFALQAGDLLRSVILRRSETEHFLLWNAYHGMFDGYSFVALLQMVLGAYREPVAEPRAPMQPHLDYEEFIAFEQAFLRTPAGQAATRFWTEKLGEFEVELPSESPSAFANLEAGVLERNLTGEECARLGKAAERFGTHPAVVLLAAYQTALNRRPPTLVSTTFSLRWKKTHRGLLGPMFRCGLLRSADPGEPREARLVFLDREWRRSLRRAYAADTIGPHGSVGQSLDPARVGLFNYFGVAEEVGDQFALGVSRGRVPLSETVTLEAFGLGRRKIPYGTMLSALDQGDSMNVCLIHQLERVPVAQAEAMFSDFLEELLQG